MNTKNNTPKQGPALLRVLGLWDSVAILIGVVIGVGIFRVPYEIARYLSSPAMILLAWLFGGIFSLMGASCYSELASSFPETGGDYVYLKKSYGLLPGFLYGWTCLLVMRTGAIAAVAFIFAEYLASFLALDSSLVKPLAIITVLLLSLVSALGMHQAKKLQNISSAAKVLTLASIVVLGFLSGKGELSNFYSQTVQSGKGLVPLFGLALIPILWTYGGWHENTYVTGETKDPRRVLPLALIIGTLMITILYLLMNLAYIYLVPVKDIAASELIASNVMQILFGKWGQKAVEALVLVSAFGAINGMIITSSRVTYAMAKDNAVFRYLAKVHEKFRTPYRSIIINALWIIVLIMWGTFGRLIFFTGVLIWAFFAFIIAGIFILRSKYPEIERPYKVWGYPLTPVIYIAICLWLVINTVIHHPLPSALGICLTLSGVPVYLLSKKSGG
ncbi:MAG: amino acid permease [Candidatus Omnitrophota bacterium]|jgi:amino acid transporter